MERPAPIRSSWVTLRELESTHRRATCDRTSPFDSATATVVPYQVSRSSAIQRWSPRPNAGSGKLEAGSGKREAGSGEREAGSGKREADSKRKPDLHLPVDERRYGTRLEQWTAADDAGLPIGDSIGLVVTLDVAPVGLDEVAVPLIQVRDPGIAEQLHPEPGGLEFVVVQHLHECRFVVGVLQVFQLVFDRGGDPLHRMTEEVQQQEALHLEPDVGVDDDPQAVEDAGSRRLEIAVLDHEAAFDDR